MTQGFYLSVDCRQCDEEIIYGLCATTIEHNGMPVIPFDIAAQSDFRCDHCGAFNYTGDFEIECDYGGKP